MERSTFLVFLTCTFGTSLLGFFGQENSLNVGKDTSLGNVDSSQELVQFFISDCKLQVSRNDASFLVVTGRVASFVGLFGQKNGLNVGKDTSLGNSKSTRISNNL